MRCGARTRRASTPSARAGAGSSGRSTTTRPRSWAGTSRRSAIGGGGREPIRQGRAPAFGSIAPKAALGVALRHDWGSQYTANTFVNEIKCWGFTDTPAFVGEPECNGCAERFMRTLKEQCLYLHQ